MKAGMWICVGIASVLILSSMPALADGERPARPSTATFTNGYIGGGRVENLLLNDSKTLKMSDSAGFGSGNFVGWATSVADRPVVSHTWLHEWQTQNPGPCHPPSTDHYICVNDTPDSHDGSSSALYYVDPPGIFEDEIAMDAVSLPVKAYSIHFAADQIGSGGTDAVVSFSLWYRHPSGTDSAECSRNFLRFPSNGTTAQYQWLVISEDTTPFETPLQTSDSWNQSGRPGFTSCAFAGRPWNATMLENLSVVMFTLPIAGDGTPIVTSLAVGISEPVEVPGHFLRADLSVGSATQYPIRAEWTCTARTGSPYYIGTTNATGIIRWLSVVRDSTNVTYSSGSMCPFTGPSEYYHAAMNISDIQGTRVHFIIVDNASDAQGSDFGNVTLDRLVAILTADFYVSGDNLGWLIYLALVIGGVLIAAWLIKRYRDG